MMDALKHRGAGAEMTGKGGKMGGKHLKKWWLETSQLGWKALAWRPRRSESKQNKEKHGQTHCALNTEDKDQLENVKSPEKSNSRTKGPNKTTKEHRKKWWKPDGRRMTSSEC